MLLSYWHNKSFYAAEYRELCGIYIWDLGNKTSFMYVIKPFDKKTQTKTKPSFYTITFSGFYHCHPQALQAKTTKKKHHSKDLFKDKADFFFNLVNAKTFWAQLIWGVRCSNNVKFQWGCWLQSLELWHFMPAEKVGGAMTFGDTCWSVPESSFMDMPWIVFIYLFLTQGALIVIVYCLSDSEYWKSCTQR